MSEVRVEVKSQGKVLEGWGRCRVPYHFLRGPLGSGKTWRAIQKILELAIEQPATKNKKRTSRGVCIRKTYPEILSAILPDVKLIIPPEIGLITYGHPPLLAMDFDLPDGTTVDCRVQFLALDKPDDANKLRGLNASWIWINEANLLPKSVFSMAQARAGRFSPDSAGFKGVFADSNSWEQDHWLEELAAEKRNHPDLMSDFEFFVQPPAVIKVDGRWQVNPAAENQALLRTGYIERQIQGKREDWIRVNLGNELGFSYDGKPVHSDYSDSRNVAVEPLAPTPGMCYVGLDFGLMPAAVFWQRQPNGQWWGFDEIPSRDRANTAMALDLKARVAMWQTRVPGLMFTFIGDPSGDQRAQTDGRTTFSVYRANGVYVRPASTNDPQLRRDALIRPLTRNVDGGRPGLLLSPTMTETRRALAGAWAYKRMQIPGTERYKDEPDKGPYSHIGEAAEYGLIDAGEHTIINQSGATSWPTDGAAIHPKAPESQGGPSQFESRLFDPRTGSVFNGR